MLGRLYIHAKNVLQPFSASSHLSRGRPLAADQTRLSLVRNDTGPCSLPLSSENRWATHTWTETRANLYQALHLLASQPTAAGLSNQATRLLRPPAWKASEPQASPRGLSSSHLSSLFPEATTESMSALSSFLDTVRVCGIDAELTLVPAGLASGGMPTLVFSLKGSVIQSHCASGQVPLSH